MRKSLLALLPLVLVLAACQTGVSMWSACSVPAGSDTTGTDGTYVLVCQGGRWEPIMTVDEFVAIGQKRPVTIAPVPEAPPATTPTTTAPPVTSPPVTSPPVTSPPVTTPPPLAYISISAGATHTCAVTNRGGAECWGKNQSGELGDGTTADSTTPVDVLGLSSGVTAISAGDDHTCAIVDDGAKCWGLNDMYQVGDNTFAAQRSTAVDVVGLSGGVTDISAGADHSCAVVSGAAMCWGSNGIVQLGFETSGARTGLAEQVFGLSANVTAISAGHEFTCAVVNSGAKCWGSNSAGQFGDGTNVVGRMAPADVSGLTENVERISAGREVACAVTVQGGARCWGNGGAGQLGNGSGASSNVPVIPRYFDSAVRDVSAGWGAVCGVVSMAAQCWGFNGSGQIGDANANLFNHEPQFVTGLTNGTTSITASDGHSCAIVNDIAKCWGLNSSGQLGDGSTVNRTEPVDVLI